MTEQHAESKVNGSVRETLEELFVGTLDLPGEIASTEGQALDSHCPTDNDQSPVTAGPIPLEAAAFLLGLPAAVVKEQVRQGTLRGFKTKTKKGKQWFVDPVEVDRCRTPVLAGDAAICLLEPDLPVTDTQVEQSVHDDQIDSPIALIRDLQKTIEALTFRNGYLEAQLTERESQIKLLTDTQIKSVTYNDIKQSSRAQSESGGWSRFLFWMFGLKK